MFDHLAGLASLTGASPPTITEQAVTSFYLTLKADWERRTSPLLEGLQELIAAESFCAAYFFPLLSPDDLKSEFTDPAIFRDATRRALRSGTVLPDAPYVTLGYHESVSHVPGGAFGVIEDLIESSLANVGPLSTTSRVTRAAMTAFFEASVPIYTLYHHCHGLATARVLAPRLESAIAVARSRLREQIAADVSSLAALQAGFFDPRRTITLELIGELFDTALVLKLSLLERFRQMIATIRKRSFLPARELNARAASVFWRLGPSDSPTGVGLGNPPKDDAVATRRITPRVWYEGSPQTFDRSFWAPDECWFAFQDLVQLMSQSGFALALIAASSPLDGRHPPHLTHRNGIEFDVDWGFPDPASQEASASTVVVVPNLARAEKKTKGSKATYIDQYTGQTFDLVPVAGDERPTTQTGIAQVATLAMFQAAVLSGFHRYLYVDATNLRQAVEYLGIGIDRTLFTEPNLTNNIPFAEGMGHYNHLHAEYGGKKGAFLTPENLLKMYQRALARDNDAEFKALMDRTPESMRKSEPLLKKFRDDWFARATASFPSLLPVWLSTKDLKKAFGLGE
jgi:hypothetical protein